MIRALKTLLLWLLIAALPLQGMAGIIQASCGPDGHDSSHLAPLSQAHHHDVHDDADLTHHMASMVDDAHASHDLSGTSDSEHVHKHSSCSACAACCVGAVAPASIAAWTPVYQKFRAVPLPADVSFTAFFPSGPERPPRHPSA